MSSDITVVIPSYNAGRFIEEALRSVLSQTLLPDEIIVVDDASTDDTVARVKTYGKAVTLIRCAHNSGGAGAPRNIGMDAARTAFVTPFDADDLMHPRKLERQMDSVRAVPEAGLHFSDFSWLLETGELRARAAHPCFRPFLRQVAGENIFRLTQPDAFDAFMIANYIGSSTSLFPKKAWRELGGYNESLRAAEDMDFFMRLSERHAFGYVDEPLFTYRIRLDSISSNRIQMNACTIDVLKRYLGMCSKPLLGTLKHHISELEINMVWHSIDAGRLKDALSFWMHALTTNAHKSQFVPLTCRYAVHSLVTFARRLTGRELTEEQLRAVTSRER